MRSSGKISRSAVWIFPLVTGITAYILTSIHLARETEGASVPEVRKGRVREKLDQTKNVEEAIAEFRQTSLSAPAQTASEESLSSLSGEQLRQTFVDLKRQLELEKDWNRGQSLFQKARRIAAELGRREGEAGVTWIEGHMDEALYDCQGRQSGAGSYSRMIRWSAIDAFAASDPSGALAHIIASDRLAPCSDTAILSLLQTCSASGAEALKEAAAQVPWYLFDHSGESFSVAAYLPHGADIQPWIESGAARFLAEQGVPVRNFFGAWTAADPEQAMTAWVSWPYASPLQRESDVFGMVNQSAMDPESARRLDEALANMDASTSAAVLPAVQKVVEAAPDLIPFYRDRLPHAFPASSTETPFQPPNK